MDISQMKNIIVLKDLPSNIVDEAIVILKNNTNVKRKEKVENRNSNKLEENSVENYELVIKEAEYIIQNYIKNIENPTEPKNNIQNMNIKYKKLQISSLLLGITTIISLIVSIIK